MKDATKLIADNRKARHQYEILDTLEAGIALCGTEVKSIRQGKLNFKDCYAQIRAGEIFLLGMHISHYEQGNRFNHEPERLRKLLLHKREITRLNGKIKQDGLTLVPLSVYLKNGRVKISLALARGKKLHDKRESSAKREAEREIGRRLKERNG